MYITPDALPRHKRRVGINITTCQVSDINMNVCREQPVGGGGEEAGRERENPHLSTLSSSAATPAGDRKEVCLPHMNQLGDGRH